MFFIMILFYVSFLSGQARNVNGNSFDNSLRCEADKLLTKWMDTFLTYQCIHPDSALDGGVLCPACARMHGRIGDAVLPLMYLAEKTGNDKYAISCNTGSQCLVSSFNLVLCRIMFTGSQITYSTTVTDNKSVEAPFLP